MKSDNSAPSSSSSFSSFTSSLSNRKKLRLIPTLLWLSLAGAVLREKTLLANNGVIIGNGVSATKPVENQQMSRNDRNGGGVDSGLVIMDDRTLEVFEQVNRHSDEKQRTDDDHHRTRKHNSADVVIVVAVDGTLAGISKETGHVLWKQYEDRGASSASNKDNLHIMKANRSARGNDLKDGKESNTQGNRYTIDATPILQPLVSTTTTTKTASSASYAVVPSVDGAVFTTVNDMTVSTSVKELVSRSPFLDPRGRFYVGSRQTTAAAIDAETGEILRVVSASGEKRNNSENDSSENKSADEKNIPSLVGRKVVWIGRVDHTVSVQDARTGIMDAQFSVAEVMSVADMQGMTSKMAWRPERSHSDGTTRNDEDGLDGNDRFESSYMEVDILNHLELPASEDPFDSTALSSVAFSHKASGTSALSSVLVSTPNGNVAFWDSEDDKLSWVADESFDSPIAFAMDAATGLPIGVDIIPDVPNPDADIVDLTREMERQLELASRDDVPDEQTIVGAMSNGQLYALPLGLKSKTIDGSVIAASMIMSTSSAAAAASKSTNTAKQARQVSHLPGRPHANLNDNHSHQMHMTNQHASHQNEVEEQFHQKHPSAGKHGVITGKKPCIYGSPSFPGCLVHQRNDHNRNRFFSEAVPPLGTGDNVLAHYQQQNRNSDASLAIMTSQFHKEDGGFYHPNLGYFSPQDLYRVQQRPHSKFYKKIFWVLGSWLPPTVALLFVVAFELGRRKRLKDEKEQHHKNFLVKVEQNGNVGNVGDLNASVQTTSRLQQNHVISVSDEILGYGGHGTVVYKGVLDGREVAVKRMLKTYHASADREISLLIESDGDPNVVRYFLKEVRGDFVYLALELCDLSLHELIGVVGDHQQLRLKDDKSALQDKKNSTDSLMEATKRILLQIASGVKHLHSLRIIHRDIKPANILLAISKRGKKSRSEDSIFDNFLCNFYDAKISDMGLGKQLIGHSSLGVSFVGESSFRGSKGMSTIGVGPGSVGWQAPEVMALRVKSDVSTQSNDSSSNPLELTVVNDQPTNPRASRSVDIFSLGCVFYSLLVPGSHPFGDWFEREANIMHNRPNVEPLKDISIEAYNLVRSMLDRNPRARPTAKEVCQHPFFWSSQKKLMFLCEFSDRLETDNPIQTTEQAINTLAIERGAVDVVGTSWEARLDNALIDNVQKFRTYDYSCVRDLLRLVRNKHHHFDELPEKFRFSTAPTQDALCKYFEDKFPALVMHCYNFCRNYLKDDNVLIPKYNIRQPSTASVPLLVKRESSEPVKEIDISEERRTDSSDVAGEVVFVDETKDSTNDSNVEAIQSCDPLRPDEDIIVWQGSAAAKTFNCRGWGRSEDEWSRHIEPFYKKRDPNLKRCMEDPKFRTRLCNHWDLSLGTYCPMKKKNKCVFAHGPVELRVKEGKKNRWGRLLDKNGDNSNPWHSGGEDTFGAASSIENVRKEEGKWNISKDKKKNQGAGSKNSSKKRAPKEPRFAQ